MSAAEVTVSLNVQIVRLESGELSVLCLGDDEVDKLKELGIGRFASIKDMQKVERSPGIDESDDTGEQS